MATVTDYFKNVDWIKRSSAMFHLLDINKNGYVSVDDWLLWIENFKKAAPNVSGSKLEKLHLATLKYAAAAGLTVGVEFNLEQYLHGMAVMCAAENEKVKRGEVPEINQYTSAWYDCMDTDGDGSVSEEEFAVVLKSANFPESTAKAVFAKLDTNKNGKLERSELMENEFKFWISLNDASVKGMYGAVFE